MASFAIHGRLGLFALDAHLNVVHSAAGGLVSCGPAG